MISQEDCMAMCGLERREIAAIAEHEHIPEIEAAALANCLLREPQGAMAIREILVDDIEDALADNRIEHAVELFATLRGFIDRNPEAGGDLALY
ncbi:MAG TPA: hypothetical protein VMU22_02950 [Rhizomicrobium sp.]|nr:hypothetical protein [Rhizomicrobium sp.]